MGNRRVVRSAVIASYDTDDYVNGLNSAFITTDANGDITGIISNGVNVPTAQSQDVKWSGLEVDLGSTTYLDANYASVAALNTEIMDRVGDVDAVENRVTQEITDRTTADTTERDARIDADNLIDQAISNETARATTAEGVIRGNLTSEIATRAAADTAEATTRASVDNALSADIATKQDILTAGTNITIVNDVISATGGANVADLNAEIARAMAAEAANTALIGTNTTNITMNATNIATNDADILTKQRQLTAGDNITIVNNSAASATISASGFATDAELAAEAAIRLANDNALGVRIDQTDAMVATNVTGIITNRNDIATNTAELPNKQDNLIAGGGIDISGRTISVELPIGGLTDVPAVRGTTGQVLAVNSDRSGLEYVTDAGGVTTLPELTDVTIITPTDNQVLTFDDATQMWVNADSSGGGATTLEQLTDVTVTAPVVGQFLGRDPTNMFWINAVPAAETPVTIFETYAHNIRAQIVNRNTELVFDAGGFIQSGTQLNGFRATTNANNSTTVQWASNLVATSFIVAGLRISVNGMAANVVGTPSFDLDGQSGSFTVDTAITYTLGQTITSGEEARQLYGQLTANVLGQVTFNITGGLTNQDINDVFSAETIARGYAPVTRGHLSNNPPLGYGALLNVNETGGRVTGEMVYASNFALGAGRARILAAPLAEVLFERFGPVGPIIMNTSNNGVDREDGVATFAGITGTVAQPGVAATVDSITFDFLLQDTTSSFASQFGSGFNTQDWVRPETGNADLNTLAAQVAANTLTGKRNAGEIQVNVEGIVNNANNVTTLTGVVATNTDNIATNTAGLLTKQDILTAGTNITIVNDVISATGGGGGSSTLPGLTDVTITNPLGTQQLTYNGATGEWVNAFTTVETLGDTIITTPTSGEFLGYNSANNEWINAIPSASGFPIGINESYAHSTLSTRLQNELVFEAGSFAPNPTQPTNLRVNADDLDSFTIFFLADSPVTFAEIATGRSIRVNGMDRTITGGQMFNVGSNREGEFNVNAATTYSNNQPLQFGLEARLLFDTPLTDFSSSQSGLISRIDGGFAQTDLASLYSSATIAAGLGGSARAILANGVGVLMSVTETGDRVIGQLIWNTRNEMTDARLRLLTAIPEDIYFEAQGPTVLNTTSAGVINENGVTVFAGSTLNLGLFVSGEAAQSLTFSYRRNVNTSFDTQFGVGRHFIDFVKPETSNADINVLAVQVQSNTLRSKQNSTRISDEVVRATAAEATKQNTLTAGTNITIVDDVISSTGAGVTASQFIDNPFNGGVDWTVSQYNYPITISATTPPTSSADEFRASFERNDGSSFSLFVVNGPFADSRWRDSNGVQDGVTPTVGNPRYRRPETFFDGSIGVGSGTDAQIAEDIASILPQFWADRDTPITGFTVSVVSNLLTVNQYTDDVVGEVSLTNVLGVFAGGVTIGTTNTDVGIFGTVDITGKQNTLVAGDGINITGDTISTSIVNAVAASDFIDDTNSGGVIWTVTASEEVVITFNLTSPPNSSSDATTFRFNNDVVFSVAGSSSSTWTDANGNTNASNPTVGNPRYQTSVPGNIGVGPGTNEEVAADLAAILPASFAARGITEYTVFSERNTLTISGVTIPTPVTQTGSRGNFTGTVTVSNVLNGSNIMGNVPSGGGGSYNDLALRYKVLLTGGFVFLTKGAKVNRQAYFGSIANETATNYFYDSGAKAWFDADTGGNMLIAFIT